MNEHMGAPLKSLLCLFAIIGSLLIASPPAGASVPDKPFTQTQCEGDSDSVARLYTAGLGRQPEQGGFDFWITEYTLGTWTFPRMAEFFVSSPEFAESYGTLTQDEFIRQLYRNVLGREGEAGGVTFWNGEMSAGMTRATVLMRFAESPENIANSGTVEPTLGPFNEGRAAGYWRCGPSLNDSLLQLDDFGPGWQRQVQNEVDERVAGDCDASLYMPLGSQGVVFSDPASSDSVLQASYIAPTKHGADRYMTQVRDALAECGSYVDSTGSTVTVTEVVLADFGDDSVALRFSYERLGLTYGAIVIQHGRLVTVIQDSGSVDNTAIETYAGLMVQRVAELPFTP